MVKMKKDFRKGPDVLVKSKNALVGASWFLFLIIFFTFSSARQKNMLGQLYGTSVLSSWDTTKVQIAFALTIVLGIVCAIGLFINSQRHNRKTDMYSLSLVIFAFISLIGIIVYPFIG